MAFPLLAGASLLDLGGRLLNTQSERERKRRLRREQLAALGPLEAMQSVLNYGNGLTEADSNLASGLTQQTLQGLSNRGILYSSYTAPAVAREVAPIQERANARRQGLIERLAAAKQSIYEDTQLPGYGDAFAGTLGQVGGVLSLAAGEKYNPNPLREPGELEKYLQTPEGQQALLRASGRL